MKTSSSPSPRQKVTHLLYLHGFRSSPRSAKAQQMAEHVARQHPQVRWWCPQLPPSPREAASLLLEGMAGWPGHSTAVMGSSLGGYYASWVAQQIKCRSVLLNPAVQPARDLKGYVGQELAAWNDPAERFVFLPQYIEELHALDVRQLGAAAPELLIIAQGDELLDWREMSARYPHALQVVQEGGNHALDNFAEYLPRVDDFFGWG